MELVSGKTLRQKITGPLLNEELIDIGVQMADGLSAAHAAGITHRDIKPENVMVAPGAASNCSILD
jgi:serine/threonine protein kinase